MVYLMLLRHAKSDWSEEGTADIDRPLNPRGRRAAPEMARWMLEHHFLPDRVLCSSARRTRETLTRMQEEWAKAPANHEPQIHFIDRLYLAPPQTILETAIEHAQGASAILVLGHNPGMEMLATQLSQRHIEMPTCAIMVFEAKPTWPEDWWDSSSWSLVAHQRPKHA